MGSGVPARGWARGDTEVVGAVPAGEGTRVGDAGVGEGAVIHTARVAPEKAVFRPALPLCSAPDLLPEKTLALITYLDQLKHPQWQRRRLEIMQRDAFTCQSCLSTESTLHVHHKLYIKGRMLWEYEDRRTPLDSLGRFWST